ncbi:MAG: serine hydrolase domain-containing protein [Nitrospirota bacterium]
MEKTISQKMQEAVTSGVFPGAVLLVSHKGNICFHKSFGFAQHIPNKVSLTLNTLFDLASLTKPLSTTAAMANLVAAQQIRLNDPVSKFIPGFNLGSKKKVTLAHLLHHSSGLPAWKPYYEEIILQNKTHRGFLGSDLAKQKVYEMASAESLINTPGTTSLYSDIGFILLGAIIENVVSQPLHRFCEDQIFSKLKCKKTGFPLLGKTIKGTVAATENCPWRKKVICGEVHDDNAYAMGGAAGHAGLFSTAKEVWLLVADWMDSIKGEGSIDPLLAKLFVTKKRLPKGTSFGLGWDSPQRGAARTIRQRAEAITTATQSIPATRRARCRVGRGKDTDILQMKSPKSAFGQFSSSKSFGHLGFTGTSIFADCVNDLVIILLSNRVHPTRNNDKIKMFRPEIHDLIFKEVLGG